MDNRRKIASLLNNIGVLYETQGNYEQALNYYQKSLELAKTLENDRGIARTLNNMGVIHYRQRHYDLALQCYHESLTLKKSSEDQVGIANTLQNIGEVHRRQGNYAQALRSYQESLGLWKTMEAKAGIASALSSMGDVYKAQREYPQALDFYQKSLTLAEDVGDPDAIFRCYWDFGEVYREQGRKQEAIAAYQKAVEMIESMRSQVAGNEQEQQRFFEDRVSPYYKVVELLIEQNNFTQALTYAERAKARVLLDVLQSGRVNVTKAMTDAEREKERKLNNELVSLNMQIQREKDDTRRADLRASLDNRRLEYEAFRTSLYASHPELKVKRGEVEPITLNEAYALLSDAKTALLEFVVAEEKTFLFVLTKSPQPTLKVYPINITRKDLAQRTERFRQQLAYNDLSRFPRSARALFDLLLKPAQAQLQGKTTLCMVPDRELWELPFQALQPKENHYLIADAAVFYAPSLTALREMRKRSQQKTSTPLTLLAFGNPTFGKATVERVQLARRDETLDPLPEAEEEVKQLGQLYGAKQSRVYFGAAAQEGRAKSDAGQCQVLHFATHGILDNSSPMYSRIVLSQAEGNTAEDGLLEAWELMNLDLKADLVVLSACQTARGRAASGEGMIGLTWALFVAGCPTTVASQWSVKSDSTKELMIEFHRQLQSAIRNPQSKITKAEALRQAMVKMVRRQDNYKYPHFWAGFVLAGDGG
jgi:CHAT domain-containing protein